jgi:hypothetical protein
VCVCFAVVASLHLEIADLGLIEMNGILQRGRGVVREGVVTQVDSLSEHVMHPQPMKLRAVACIGYLCLREGEREREGEGEGEREGAGGREGKRVARDQLKCICQRGRGGRERKGGLGLESKTASTRSS